MANSLQEKLKADFMAKQSQANQNTMGPDQLNTKVDTSMSPEDNVAVEVLAEEAQKEAAKRKETFTIPTPEQLKQIKAIDELSAETRIMTDEEVFEDASIEAKPLYMPEMLSVKPKDPNYILRWVNFKNQSGMNLQRMQLMGFTNASPKDVEGLNPEIMLHDGALRYMDVILMKIQRLRYQQHLKANYIKNQLSVGNKVVGAAKDTVSAALRQDSRIGSAMAQGKVSVFVPSEAEADAMIRANKAAG